MNGPVKSLLDIAVIEDDVRALAAELEGDLFKVRLRSDFHNFTADEGTASEGDLLDVGVDGDGVTDTGTVAVDDVDDTRREASLLDEVSEDQSGQRGLLGCLEHNRVAGGQSRANLPGQHE